MKQTWGNAIKAALYDKNMIAYKHINRDVYCSICGKPVENKDYKLCRSCAKFIESMKKYDSKGQAK